MTRAFISFDFDHDEELRNALVGQSKNQDSPFSIGDWSVYEPFEERWRERVRERIRRVDVVIFMCGEHTHDARGVSAEMSITREEGKRYFLLWGRPNKTCKPPKGTLKSDKIYKWTWPNLKVLISGAR